jgi:hypothetical protein
VHRPAAVSTVGIRCCIRQPDRDGSWTSSHMKQCITTNPVNLAERRTAKILLVDKGPKGIQTSVGEDTHSVRSSTAACVEVKEQVYKRIRDNRKISTDIHFK